ncbi:hypothetical protein DEIPH_ctg017orf0042 [Deinococcus phoenicis]|uniref:DUF3108 domain-containing protein n=1 Tax=Deinococcus phoenicis TaxID=1476583 RepID=A0A016QSF1_9DEIO|nr:hypothetical protein [Deinococcus phoenicis]EYB68709.1 hypothetical protein DEIPH_ctg017orf0042 [Deinococcus phoenicis]
MPVSGGLDFRTQPEAFTLTLTLGGRYAGQQEWAIHAERSAVVARVQTDFGGVLPELRRVQSSRMHPRFLTSLHYAEGDGRGRATFETTFDRKAGLVTLRQGKEEAAVPLTTEYHDPVSLLLWLRGLEDVERTQAQLTGGRVLVQRLAESEVGGVPAHAYFLRPGGAYVYVEQAPPHRLLRLIQPTDFGPVEATLQPPRKPQPERRRRRAS